MEQRARRRDSGAAGGNDATATESPRPFVKGGQLIGGKKRLGPAHKGLREGHIERARDMPGSLRATGLLTAKLRGDARVEDQRIVVMAGRLDLFERAAQFGMRYRGEFGGRRRRRLARERTTLGLP